MPEPETHVSIRGGVSTLLVTEWSVSNPDSNNKATSAFSRILGIRNKKKVMKIRLGCLMI